MMTSFAALAFSFTGENVCKSKSIGSISVPILPCVDAFEANHTTNYHAYWNLRHTQSDPANYDPTHRVTLSASERSYFDEDPAQIDEEESRRTKE